MKLIVHEFDESFEFAMEPETIADCAMLARIAKNGTRNVLTIATHAHTDLTMTGYVAIGKRKQPTSSL